MTSERKPGGIVVELPASAESKFCEYEPVNDAGVACVVGTPMAPATNANNRATSLKTEGGLFLGAIWVLELIRNQTQINSPMLLVRIRLVILWYDITRPVISASKFRLIRGQRLRNKWTG